MLESSIWFKTHVDITKYLRLTTKLVKIIAIAVAPLNTIDAAAPEAPAGLKAKVSGKNVMLSWTAGKDEGSGVKEYVVKYSHDGQEFTATTAGTSFVIENADPATWQWSVKAADAVGNVSDAVAGDAFTVT